MIIANNRVMEKSNLTARFDNHDYDGDSLISLALHTTQAREDFKYAYVKNLVEFEHMDELLIDYEHESIYSAYMLTVRAAEITTEEISPISLFDIEFTIEDFIDKEKDAKKRYIEYPDTPLTNVEAAINQVLLQPKHLPELPLYNVERDGLLTKKNLTKLTASFWKYINGVNLNLGYEENNFWDVIHELDKFFLECSAVISDCSPSFDLKDFVVQNDEIDSFKKNLIKVEPFIAFHQNLILFEKVSEEIEKNSSNILNRVFKSGARLKSVQLLKAASNSGIPTDIYGKAFAENIHNSLLDGLTPKEYFMTGDSARLALAQRQESIPKGGELQRKFFFTVGILKLDKDKEDCGSTKYFEILVKNKDHLALLNHRWYLNPDTNEEELVDINNLSLIGHPIKLRSPVTCAHPDYKICKRCMGDKLPESVNLGATVGAALSEGIIQSVLRTHHFGGAFIASENKELLEVLHRCRFEAPDIIYGEPEDVTFIMEYLSTIYDEEEWDVEDLPGGIRLIIHELPFNDDSVKLLNGIVGLIDRNRDESSLIPPDVLYDKLESVIEQNNILSSYLELIVSLLYYDEDGILYRYTDKEPKAQVALKNIVEVLDPKMSIFYNFSNRIISKIYNKKVIGTVDHMYHDLLECYL